MRLVLKHPYLSIKNLKECELPEFSVIVGRNGVGKTQLIDAIKENHIAVSEIPNSAIEKYDLNTFRPSDAGVGHWASATFPESTVSKYFSPSPEGSLVEISKRVFDETLERFSFGHDPEAIRTFKNSIRQEIRNLPDFATFKKMGGDEAVVAYSVSIIERIFEQLRKKDKQNKSSRSNRRESTGNDPAILVSLALKLNNKLPHELIRDDVLRASYYEGGTIINQISQIFTRYKVEQYSWALNQSAISEKSVKSLMLRYREMHPPPWKLLRENLDKLRDTSDDPELFNFDFSDPEDELLLHPDHLTYSFSSKFTNRSTGESYSVTTLSSGEKILLSLCLASFNKELGRRQPKLILFDELDAVLHPSMISAFISGLKELFINAGTQVILATHSITTVSVLDEGEIFNLIRNGGIISIEKIGKKEAVAALSDGLATVDMGLRIATSSIAAPITILSEGNNVKHLKKWAGLFFPEVVRIFEEMPARTGKDQLITYGQLLDKMVSNSHFLIVFDCDATAAANRLGEQVVGSCKVTSFALKKRENKIVSKGIENKYDEKYLTEYHNITKRAAGNEEVSRSMSKEDKAAFASHVYSNGTRDYFEHFEDLHKVVETILESEVDI